MFDMGPSNDPLLLEVKDGFAVITFNQPKKKNAMDFELYRSFAQLLYTVDARDDVVLTLVTGRGDFFSAGADVKMVREQVDDVNVRSATLSRLTQGNMDLARALYSHSKILVAALNGPAIGLSAALLGWFDFVYAVEQAYIFTPFSTLSLVAEGGASLTFPRRMGISKANEALIMGKKLGAAELQANGFINKVFPQSPDNVFKQSVIAYLQDKFSGLDMEACQVTKDLIKAGLPDPDTANLREIWAGVKRFQSGKPQAEFAKFANKTKRHKL